LDRANSYYDSGQYDSAEIEYKNVLQAEPSNTIALSRIALIYIGEGRVHSAIPFLLRMRQLEPANPEIGYQIGLVELNSGQLKEARNDALSILRQRPTDPDAMSLLAQTASDEKEFEDTRERLQKMADSTSTSAPAWIALGTLDLRQHKLKDAEAAFRRAVALDPTSSSAFLALGALLWLNKDVADADQAFATASKLASPRSTTRLRYAQFKLRTGDPDGATLLLEEMIKQSPDYLPASILMAEIAANQKKYELSASLIAKVLMRDPSNPEGLLFGARLHLAQGENKKAVEDLERMQKIYPNSPQVYFHLGQAYVADRDAKKAIVSLNRAIVLDPDFPDAELLLAESDIQNGDAGSAHSLMESLTNKHPEVPQAELLLAAADRSLGYLDEALGVYSRLEKAFPRNPEAPLLAGLILVQQGKLDDARASFGKSLQVAPDYIPAIEQLINMDIVGKQYQAALQRANAEAIKAPQQAAPQLLIAKVYLAQGDMKSAEIALLNAIKLQPDFQVPYFLLARLYIASNRQQMALNDLQKALTENPKDIRALMTLGNLYDQEKDFPSARDTYERLLAIDPQFSGALNNLAYLYSDVFDQQEKAFELAQRARELLPNEPHVIDTLGWILYKKHQYPWAMSLLEESAGRLPTEAEAQFHLGMVQYMMGNEASAQNALQKALSLDHGFSGSVEASECLSILAIGAGAPPGGMREMLANALTTRPNDPIALERLASLDAGEAEVGKAIDGYQAALKASPAYSKASLGLAKLYVAQSDNRKALELLKNARRLDPNDPGVAHALGRLVFQTGDFPWASSLLKESAIAQPDDPEVLYDLAIALYSQGRVNDSVTSMQDALRHRLPEPQASDGKRFMDMIALSNATKRTASEADGVQAILKAEPDYVPALMALGSFDEDSRNSAEGLKTYEKVLSLYPDFTPAMKQLIVLDSENAIDDPKSVEFVMKATEAFPDDPALEKASGIIAFRSGDFSKAANFLVLGERQLGDDPDLVYYLGMAQYRLNMRIECRETLQRALKLNVNAEHAAEARSVLAELK
jgi:tetratricopeptide (TPR) repeat protein